MKIREVKQTLTEEMTKTSQELHFEQAGRIKSIIEQLDNYQARSTTSEVIGDALVASAASTLSAFFVNYFEIHDGNIIAGRTLEGAKRGSTKRRGNSLLPPCRAHYTPSTPLRS